MAIGRERFPVCEVGVAVGAGQRYGFETCSEAAGEAVAGEIFNVGVDKPNNFKQLAETIVDIAKEGTWEYAPFSPERAAQEPGN